MAYKRTCVCGTSPYPSSNNERVYNDNRVAPLPTTRIFGLSQFRAALYVCMQMIRIKIQTSILEPFKFELNSPPPSGPQPPAVFEIDTQRNERFPATAKSLNARRRGVGDFVGIKRVYNARGGGGDRVLFKIVVFIYLYTHRLFIPRARENTVRGANALGTDARSGGARLPRR